MNDTWVYFRNETCNQAVKPLSPPHHYFHELPMSELRNGRLIYRNTPGIPAGFQKINVIVLVELFSKQAKPKFCLYLQLAFVLIWSLSALSLIPTCQQGLWNSLWRGCFLPQRPWVPSHPQKAMDHDTPHPSACSRKAGVQIAMWSKKRWRCYAGEYQQKPLMEQGLEEQPRT